MQTSSRTPSRSLVSEQSIEPLPPATVIDARPAALLNGRTITWSELRPVLAEFAGGVAIEEVVLERQLRVALADESIIITDDDVEAERRLLEESLSDDRDLAVRLVQELRNRQGLGEHRFRGLLWRNAALRALVRGHVHVSEEAIARLQEILHGEKRIARLITQRTLAEAYRAMNRVVMGEQFIDVAVDLSTDASAPRGGLLEPIGRDDPAYPQAIRDALWSLRLGELSPPILLDDQYAILKLERVVPARDDATLASSRPELERLTRINQERLLMDELARRMLDEAAITIYDDALAESWRTHRGATVR